MLLPAPSPAWHAITRFGEAQVMLPAAVALLLWLVVRPSGRALVGWWLGLMLFAAAITTASKIAFIGFGWGVAEWNFTGVSGHAMFAAVIYPLLFRVLAADRAPAWQHAGLAAGIALAFLVGISRLVLGAHSPSEVFAGWALGGLAGGAALAVARVPSLRLPIWLPLGVLALLPSLGTAAPPSRSHDIVTRLSLVISGRSVPYTRRQMLRELHSPQRQADAVVSRAL